MAYNRVQTRNWLLTVGVECMWFTIYSLSKLKVRFAFLLKSNQVDLCLSLLIPSNNNEQDMARFFH